MSLRSLLPALLTPWLAKTVVGLGLAAALAQAGPARWLAAAATVAYGAWVVAEGWLATRAEAARPVGAHDRGTLEAYAVARTATALAAPACAGPLAGWLPAALVPAGLHPALVGLGAALVALGAGLRLAAIRALGAGYSHRVRPVGAVVTGGPYALVRHPAYAGMLLAHAGWVVAFPSAIAAAALLLGLVPAVAARIAVEERTLAASPAWRAYAEGRARLIPGVV